MPTLILNFKNYKEALGSKTLDLARAAEKAAKETGVNVIVVPPTPSLALVASEVEIPLFCQAVSDSYPGQSTGAVPPEAALAAGAVGTLLNHSESRLFSSKLPKTMLRSQLAGLDVCLCSSNPSLIRRYADVHPQFFAIEPPELIGMDRSVSKTRPDLVRKAIAASESSNFQGEVLCGAGIRDGNDVKTALNLGAGGVIVSSAVVKSVQRQAKLIEIAGAMRD